MFLYRVKVDELETARMIALKGDLERSEGNLRTYCPIREMSVIAADDGANKLDIYLALDDCIGHGQLERLASELDAMLNAAAPSQPRVSTELIHI